MAIEHLTSNPYALLVVILVFVVMLACVLAPLFARHNSNPNRQRLECDRPRRPITRTQAGWSK